MRGLNVDGELIEIKATFRIHLVVLLTTWDANCWWAFLRLNLFPIPSNTHLEEFIIIRCFTKYSKTASCWFPFFLNRDTLAATMLLSQCIMPNMELLLILLMDIWATSLKEFGFNTYACLIKSFLERVKSLLASSSAWQNIIDPVKRAYRVHLSENWSSCLFMSVYYSINYGFLLFSHYFFLLGSSIANLIFRHIKRLICHWFSHKNVSHFMRKRLIIFKDL